MLRLIVLLLRQRLIVRRTASADHAAVGRRASRAPLTRRASLWACAAALGLGAAVHVSLPEGWRESNPIGAPSLHAAAAERATLRLRVAGVEAPPLLVYLERTGGDAAVASAGDTPPTVELTSIGSVFEPAFQIAPRAARVQIGNADAVAHNTHLFDGRRRTLFNVALPQEGAAVTRVLARTGLFEVRCDLHAWMRAAVFVPPNAHHLLIHEAGEFALGEIAPGHWRLHVWTSARGESVQAIELAPGATEVLDVAAR